jgi:phage shock protein A
MTQETQAKRELDQCQEQINKMQSYAIKAVEAGNEDDARRFLAEKATLSAKLTTLQSTYAVASDNAKKMREMHDKLTADIKEIELRKEAIKSKLAVAKAQERVNNYKGQLAPATKQVFADVFKQAIEYYENARDLDVDKVEKSKYAYRLYGAYDFVYGSDDAKTKEAAKLAGVE